MATSYTSDYLRESASILAQLPVDVIEAMAESLRSLRDGGGRLFILGVGGGAGHASHAVCDFRKIAEIEAYAPTDNVSELTARVNDEGWEDSVVGYLKASRLRQGDGVLVFSVGGGDVERNISGNLVRALEHARSVGARILAIVGRDGGFAARVADLCVVVPVVNPSTVTPHTESMQSLVWHLLVSHPQLQCAPMKWEAQTQSGPGRPVER